MKKFLFALCALALALPVAAADANNIKMVTYFPVPYAAYGDLGVTGTCDVGLMGQCALDAGEGLKVAKASSDSRALNTGSIIVRKGTLGLTPQTSVALGTQLTAGSGTGTGVLEFSHDLAVTSINSSRLAKARAMNEAQMTSLNMYGHAFPKCDESGNEISWKKLTLGKKSGVFLVCGAGEKVECEPPAGESTTKSCPSGYTGTQTRTWNKSLCKWNDWTGNCTPKDDKPSYCTWTITSYKTFGPGSADTVNSNYNNWKNYGIGSENCTNDGATPGSTSTDTYGQTCYYVNGASQETSSAGGKSYITIKVPFMTCK